MRESSGPTSKRQTEVKRHLAIRWSELLRLDTILRTGTLVEIQANMTRTISPKP